MVIAKTQKRISGGETLFSRFHLRAVEAAVMLMFDVILGLGLDSTAQKDVFYAVLVERQTSASTLVYIVAVVAISTFNTKLLFLELQSFFQTDI